MTFIPSRWGEPLSGIVQYFNTNYPNSLNNYVKVRVSSTTATQKYASPNSVINYSIKDKQWASVSDRSDPWIMIYFSMHKIAITHYTLMTRDDSYENIPKSWIFSGSKDSKTWTDLHNVSKTTEITPEHLYVHARSKVNDVFSYFNVTMKERNTGNNYHFHVKRFELFGMLCRKGEDCILTRNISSRVEYFILLLCLILAS